MAGQTDFFTKQNMSMICCDETCSVYKMENETGDGTAAVYDVFPGVFVMYNDFHLEKCPSRQHLSEGMIAIHHCREGRIEWEVGNGHYLYLAPGDIMVDSASVKAKNCSFPVSHYHGITISISINALDGPTRELFRSFSLDAAEQIDRFEKNRLPFVMHGSDSVDHILSELYRVPDNIRLPYLRLKVIELLIYLRTAEPEKDGEERPYFYRTQVERIKAIHALITGNPEERYTTESLARQFDMSVSALKSCFKGVYGEAIYTYLKNFRLDLAASLLITSDLSVTEIAGKIGYSNVSKFSEAFRKAKGVSPLEYRKAKS